MKTPQSDVLAWLQANHPKLEYEVDRDWVWIITDLRADDKTRKEIGVFGFRFKRHGEHKLPSGQTGRWSHHCEHPIKGKPNSAKSGRPATRENPPPVRPEFLPTEPENDLEALIRADLGLA